MLKRYYNISEAADFLSSENNVKIGERDLLDLAARGEIRLCNHIAQSSGICFYDTNSDSSLKELMIDPYFEGYIEIPKKAIRSFSSDKEILLREAKIIEIINSFWHRNKLPEPDLDFYFVRKVEIYNEQTMQYSYTSYKINFPHALIPTQDILSLNPSNQKNPRFLPEKLLNTTERNSFLTIIGLMAKNGYADDLSKPYSLAKEIVSAAELLGIKISVDNIAGKFKEAKIILSEKLE